MKLNLKIEVLSDLIVEKFSFRITCDQRKDLNLTDF